MADSIVVELECKTWIFKLSSAYLREDRREHPIRSGSRRSFIGGTHNVYRVYVYHERNRVSATFHDSPRDWEMGIRELDRERHILAFYSLVSDALDALEYDYFEFCDQMCFDSAERSSSDAYNGCRRAIDKLRGIGFDGDLYDLHHRLYPLWLDAFREKVRSSMK